MTGLLHLVLALAAVLATWFVVGWFVLVGNGLLLLRLFGAKRLTVERVLMAGPLGLAAVIAWLQLWHFFSPINLLAGGVAAISGLLGTGFWSHQISAWNNRVEHRPRWPRVVFCLLALWCADRAIGPGAAHDSGLYHYQAILWNNAYPVVPGLGNLHHHLAFNNSSLLYQAMLDTPGTPWHGRANHLGNGVLLVGLVALAMTGIARLIVPESSGGPPRPRIPDLYAAVLLVPAVMLAVSKEASSPRTDLPAAVCVLFIVWRLLAMATTSVGDGDATSVEGSFASRRDGDESRRVDLLFITVVASAAVCLKLSTAAFALAAWLTAAVFWLRTQPSALRAAVRPLALCIVLSVALVGPWIVRGYILSGYPFFPSTALGANVDWRVPEAIGKEESTYITSWSRLGLGEFLGGVLRDKGMVRLARLAEVDDPKAAVHGVGWVRPWLISMLATGPTEVMVSGVVILAAAIALAARRRRRTIVFGGAWIALVAPLAGVLFWFAVAPEPRFGYGVLWALAAALTAVACDGMERIGRRLIVVLCVLATIPIAHRAAVNTVLYHTRPLSDVPFYGAGEDHGLHPLPTPTFEPYTTRWGLVILRPTTPGALAWDGWDPHRPTTPFPELIHGLRMRHPEDRDFHRGFRTEGPPLPLRTATQPSD